jgi:hypothetical protein
MERFTSIQGLVTLSLLVPLLLVWPASTPMSLTAQSDAWTPMTMDGAPSPRGAHTAVWTGTEMVIWGGAMSVRLPDGRTQTQMLNTGGRYNPMTNTWTPTSLIGAPSPRLRHTAVWTGQEMIIWGGVNAEGCWLNTGARYDPTTNTWAPISTMNAPTAREYHTAVWTGAEMIVWGGRGIDERNRLAVFNTGGRYNPETDTWSPLNTEGAPTGRFWHTAVYTSEEMIVWGGTVEPGFYPNDIHPTNTGGRYKPSTDTWSAMTTTRAPEVRVLHTAVWTGHEMIIFGGFFNQTLTPKRYNPRLDVWLPVSRAPEPRDDHTAVWTGSEMIIWGGDSQFGLEIFNTGARYNPTRDWWTPTSSKGAPGLRVVHTAVWTGSEMIIWGGQGPDGTGRSVELNTGGRYKP